MSRVLVTGAAGFIGSHLVDRLLGAGHEVLGVDGFTTYYPRELKLRNLARAELDEGFRLVEGDLLELPLARLLAEVDSVVHLAAEPGVRASWGDNFSRYLKRNVEVTQRLLEALSAVGPRRLVLASSSSRPRPPSTGRRARVPSRRTRPGGQHPPMALPSWPPKSSPCSTGESTGCR